MTKTTCCISIDTEVLKRFQAICDKRGVSSAIERFMESSLNIEKKDILGIDKELLKIEIEKKKRAQLEVTAELSKDVEQLLKIEQGAQEEEISRLEKEKEIIDKANSCIKCKGILHPSNKLVHIVDNYGSKLCNGCYQGTEKKELHLFLKNHKEKITKENENIAGI